MKNTFILLLLLTIASVGFSQATKSDKDVNDQKRQMVINEKESQYFLEQVESLGTAIETESEENILAVKKLIETSMEREIEQSKLRVASQTAATPNKNKATKGRDRENYLIQKRAAEADVRKADSNADAEDRSAALLSNQLKIYRKYAEIEKLDKANLRTLHKLAVVFHDTLMDDLEHQAAQMQANKGGN